MRARSSRGLLLATASLLTWGMLPVAAVAASVERLRVEGVRTAADRIAVERTGANVVEADHGALVVTASESQRRKLKRLPFVVRTAAAPPPPARTSPLATRAFPVADRLYHSYDRVTSWTEFYTRAYPSTTTRFTLGRSAEGREIWAMKISDNPYVDEDEPEVLLTAGQHGREHLGTEMAMHLIDELGGRHNVRARSMVESLEIYIVPSVNPDGAEFDVATGSYVYWRKNRQPTPGSTHIGTDLNRNWAWNWGCCGGSSASPDQDDYRGPAPFSAPETAALRDFVNSRVVGGKQQIKASIDFHAFSERVMWPYGYTKSDTVPNLRADDERALRTIGTSMASTNGYLPQQASDLYVHDGTIIDWLWGAHRIFAYTFEMYPKTGGVEGFSPPDEVIDVQTVRNDEAVLTLLELSDCPYRAIGKQTTYCGPAKPVFEDDLESTRGGWQILKPGTATEGLFQRANPDETSRLGIKQLGTPTSGSIDLVTGPRAGVDASDNDVDGGTTSLTSKPIALYGGSSFKLRFRYYMAHDSKSSSADSLRVRVNDETVLLEQGAANDDDASFATAAIDISRFANKVVRIKVEATDAGPPSLVEAAVDDISITRG